MINYTQNYFDLKLLRIKDIKLHETTETKRLRNIFDRIAKDRKLINPVIVGKHKDNYILIDGANRLSSLQDIGCQLVLAQIIDYNNKRIKLKGWNHLIYNFDLQLIEIFCKSHKLEHEKIKYSAGKQIYNSSDNILLATDIKTEDCIIVYLPGNLDQSISDLNKLTRLYFNVFQFDRSESEIKLPEIRKFTRRRGILIEFPLFDKKTIIKIAENKITHKIPAGITRHILINRVLHVRFNIKNLLNENDIEIKTTELEKYLLNKIDNNKVRQYTESVIVFDE
jgi:hypothetical protein